MDGRVSPVDRLPDRPAAAVICRLNGSFCRYCPFFASSDADCGSFFRYFGENLYFLDKFQNLAAENAVIFRLKGKISILTAIFAATRMSGKLAAYSLHTNCVMPSRYCTSGSHLKTK